MKLVGLGDFAGNALPSRTNIQGFISKLMNFSIGKNLCVNPRRRGILIVVQANLRFFRFAKINHKTENIIFKSN